jgi:hypothetical protein
MVRSVLYLDLYNNGSRDLVDPVVRQIELQNVTKLPDHIGYLSHFYDLIEKRKSNIDFVEKDKIYFTPGCSVPRGKFKTYCEDKNIRVTRDSSKANYIVYSEKSVIGLFSQTWEYTISSELMINLITNSNLFNQSTTNLIINTLDKAEYRDKVLISYQTKNILEKCILLLKNIGFIPMDTEYKNEFDRSKKIIRVDDRKSFELLFDPNTKVINQELILSKINSDNVINKEMYESIEKLFQSNQESDWTVAMEIMANSDLDNSALYNFLLFKHYYGSRMAYAKSRNHVNFKSMLEYYGVNKYSNITLDVIIDFLKLKGVFNQYAYDLINEMYVKEIKSYLGDWRFKNIDFNVFDFKINTEIDAELDEPINQIEEECLNLEA